jgi:hypothetical protein
MSSVGLDCDVRQVKSLVFLPRCKCSHSHRISNFMSPGAFKPEGFPLFIMKVLWYSMTIFPLDGLPDIVCSWFVLNHLPVQHTVGRLIREEMQGSSSV